MNIQTPKKTVISPQWGAQYKFCTSDAEIVFYGGQAYGGKSFGLLIDALRNVNDPTYTAVIFRRKYNEIVSGSGLWNISRSIYPKVHGNYPIRGKTEWWFGGAPDKGAVIKFGHLNQEDMVYDHQGDAWVYLGFDELTHFTMFQFFYLYTRNRPPVGCKLKPCCRATFNADADSWVSEMIQWYWDPETGYPIEERSGVVRYFTVQEDSKVYKVKWVDKDYRDEDGNPPISFTFIHATMEDNPIGVAADPEYKKRLSVQDRVTRQRLLYANFKITFSGNVFDPAWFGYADERPKGVRYVRYWDLAATEVSEKDKNDPDWTAGVLGCVYENEFYICDVVAFRLTPGKAEKLMRDTAEADGPGVEQWWEEEKGASGKWANKYLEQIFSGYECHADPVSGSKVERALPWAAWAEFGRVVLVRGDWNKRFLGRAGKFPDGKRDEIDGASGVFRALKGSQKVLNKYTSYHFKFFSREKCDFDIIQPQNVEVYLSLWMDDIGGVYGGCYIWSLVNQRCRLYNEIFMSQFTPQQLYDEIVDKIVVPIQAKNQSIQLTKAIGNDNFFKAINENVSKTLKRKGIRIRPVNNYDETAAILRLNEMFGRNQVIVHGECVESDVQIRGWMYDQKKPAEGYPLARAMCLLVNDLRANGRMQQRMMPKQYSRGKQAIREHLKKSSIYTTPSLDQNRQYEYLIR